MVSSSTRVKALEDELSDLYKIMLLKAVATGFSINGYKKKKKKDRHTTSKGTSLVSKSFQHNWSNNGSKRFSSLTSAHLQMKYK